MSRAVLALILLLAWAPGPLASQPQPAPDDFAAQVQSLVAARWSVSPGEVRLAWSVPQAEPADDPQEVRLLGTGSGGHWVVEVVGSRDRTQHRVRAGTQRYLPVAAREILRGARLAPEDVAWQESVAWGPPSGRPAEAGWPSPPDGGEGLVGWEALAALRPGDELGPPRVRPPEVVRSGEAVRVQLRQGALLVEARAEARGSGGLGDRVRVRLGNGRVVEAVIQGPGLVEILGS